jgi:hypothetical protein
MVEELNDNFGIRWMIKTLRCSQHIENILFCKSPKISEQYLITLIENNYLQEFRRYLDLLGLNNSYISIKESSNAFEGNQSLYKYLLSSAFRIDVFISRFQRLITNQDEDAKKIFIEWSSEQHKEELTPDIIKPHVIHTKEKRKFLPLVNKPKLTKSKFQMSNNPIHEIKLILEDIINRYNMILVFTFGKTKKSYITTYLAQHADVFIRLPNILSNDNTINYICAYNEENTNFHFYLLNNLSIQTFFNQGFFGYSIHEVNIYEICQFLNSNLKYFTKYKNLLPNNHISKPINPIEAKPKNDFDKFRRLIKESNLFVSESDFLNTVDENILKPLYTILKNSIDWTQKHYYDFDKDDIKRYTEEIYMYLIQENICSPKWKQEREMFTLIKSFFSEALFQYQPTWLIPQYYDVYIPSFKLAFEYQGLQHYEPIYFFGGEEGFNKREELDNRKRNISMQNNVILIEWKYNEPISKNILMYKLTQNNINID